MKTFLHVGCGPKRKGSPLWLHRESTVWNPTIFKRVASMKRGAPYFDLWALATKADLNEEELLQLAKNHFASR